MGDNKAMDMKIGRLVFAVKEKQSHTSAMFKIKEFVETLLSERKDIANKEKEELVEALKNSDQQLLRLEKERNIYRVGQTYNEKLLSKHTKT